MTARRPPGQRRAGGGRPGEVRLIGGKSGQARPTGGKPGEVRLIGGLWRRSKLPVPDRPGLRPTPDRVRETLFNWLGQDLTGWRVLDAFAGSGALGFEAGSRGAGEVQLIENDAALVRLLEASRQRLAATAMNITRADALAWMSRCVPARYDLVLLDPPFSAGLLERALALAVPLVAPGGFLYVESGDAVSEAPPGLEAWRALKAGAVHAQLFKRPGPVLPQPASP